MRIRIQLTTQIWIRIWLSSIMRIRIRPPAWDEGRIQIRNKSFRILNTGFNHQLAGAPQVHLAPLFTCSLLSCVLKAILWKPFLCIVLVHFFVVEGGVGSHPVPGSQRTAQSALPRYRRTSGILPHFRWHRIRVSLYLCICVSICAFPSKTGLFVKTFWNVAQDFLIGAA